MIALLTQAQIVAHPALPTPVGDPAAAACARMRGAGQWDPRQSLGCCFATGCIALEVTQRCNLDCSLCYLSDSAEAIHDIPLAELLRRLSASKSQANCGPRRR